MNVSGQATVGYGASVSADFSQSKINADYASVTEQTGVFAGDGGFNINIKNNTNINGAVITSTADNMPILLAQADKYENILNDKKKSFEYYCLAATSGSYIAQRKVRDFYYESNDIDNAEAWNEILKMHDTYINHIVQ